MKIRFLLCLVMALALASAASAQNLSGPIQCGKADPMHSLDDGDRDKHSMAVAKFHCPWTKPFEMGGSQTKASSIVGFAHATGTGTSAPGGEGGRWPTSTSTSSSTRAPPPPKKAPPRPSPEPGPSLEAPANSKASPEKAPTKAKSTPTEAPPSKSRATTNFRRGRGSGHSSDRQSRRLTVHLDIDDLVSPMKEA